MRDFWTLEAWTELGKKPAFFLNSSELPRIKKALAWELSKNHSYRFTVYAPVDVTPDDIRQIESLPGFAASGCVRDFPSRQES